MKKNILQTFEEFLREPLSILKKTIISITGIETDDMSQKSISVEKTEQGIQINVVNSAKAYNLLSSVIYKRNMNELRQIAHESQKSAIQQKLTQSGFGTHV